MALRAVRRGSAAALVLPLYCTVFLAEVLVMWLLGALGQRSGWSGALIDSSLLSLVLLPILHLSMRAEHALRDSEKRYRSLFENMLEGYAYCRMLFEDGAPRDFVYLDTNRAFETLTGLKDVVGKNVSEVIPGIQESNPELFETYGRVATTGQPETLVHYVDPLGIWFSVSVFSPAREYFVATFENITDRKLAETALQESAARLAGIIDSAMDCIITMDSDQRIVVFNTAAEAMFRCPAVEAIGQPLERFLPERFRAAHRDVHLRTDRFEAPAHRMGRPGQVFGLRADGQEFPCETSLSSVQVRGQRLYTAIVRDLTERVKAQEEHARAQQLEARLAALVESSDSAIIGWDTEGTIATWNPAAESLFGHTAAQAIGQRASLIVPPELIGESAAMTGRIARGEVVHMETERITRSGQRLPVAMTYFPLRGPGGVIEGFGGTYRDLTDQRREESERKRLEAQVRESQKLESLGLLARGVAHDFNNLLLIVVGSAKLALKRLPAHASGRDEIEAIGVAASAATELARQLMLFAGTARMEQTPLDLSQLVSDMARLLKVAAQRKARVETRLSLELPLVAADATQVRQLVMNLVSNAAEAIERAPGTITVATGALDAGQDDLDRAHGDSKLKPGHCVYLEVVDDGAGMDPETLGHLFEPFFTTKPAGHGLGMASVFGIVRSHGGAIVVDSAPSAGTTFRVLFPALSAPQPDAP